MQNDLGFVEQDLSAGAASIRCRKAGTGAAVVFLHGFPLSGRTWDRVIAQLAPRFTCYTLDLIGLGESRSTIDFDYSSPGQAAAFRSVLNQLGVGSYALVGNDTGGWMARELALIDAPRVTHLVLTNTEIPLHRPPWIPTYQRLALLPGSGTMLQQLLRSRLYRQSPLAFGGCFSDPSLIEGDFRRNFIEPLIASKQRIDGAMRFLRNMNFTRLDAFKELHRQLNLPTLFVWGADDPTFPEPLARAMLAQFPHVAGFESVPKAKLFVYEEHPERVASSILAFLASADTATAGRRQVSQ